MPSFGAQNAHLSRAEPEHLLCAMLEDADCAAGVMLASMGVQLTEAVRECRQLSGQFILPIQPRTSPPLAAREPGQRQILPRPDPPGGGR